MHRVVGRIVPAEPEVSGEVNGSGVT